MTSLGTVLLTLVAVAAFSGCSSGNDAPTKPVDELAAHDGKPCPEQLPTESSGHAQKSSHRDRPATATPSLPRAEAAWVCTYALPKADGISEYVGGWPRTSPPRRLDAAETDGIVRQVSDLQPEEKNQVCTSDLGRRVMVVLSWRGDLTGLVIDDFGCRTVRMTDEPFKTVAGDATQGGAVSGALAPSATLRSALLGAAGPG